ncbi:hypothetical protein, partial [Thioalkalivibrio sp.]|uniref:hypothetical protein n=1 Tax=Thioalkalivibrio sp. TaxID=2093813 RepID=UPI00397532DE
CSPGKLSGASETPSHLFHHEAHEDTKKSMGPTLPPETFAVFVVFVVKSTFPRPGEGKGLIYHEDREDHEGFWGGVSGPWFSSCLRVLRGEINETASPTPH